MGFSEDIPGGVEAGAAVSQDIQNHGGLAVVLVVASEERIVGGRVDEDLRNM